MHKGAGAGNVRNKRQCGFLLGPGLTLVLDHIQVDDRRRVAKTHTHKLETF
jgi:hypothetical protein